MQKLDGGHKIENNRNEIVEERKYLIWIKNILKI